MNKEIGYLKAKTTFMNSFDIRIQIEYVSGICRGDPG